MTKVTLEPELEILAILWTPAQRMDAARKMERWARQLRVSAKIMNLNNGKSKKKEMPRISKRKATLN